MGSVARDMYGDMALGYSRSSAAAGDYPSLYLSGQTAGEAVGTTAAETLIFQGSGSQTDEEKTNPLEAQASTSTPGSRSRQNRCLKYPSALTC